MIDPATSPDALAPAAPTPGEAQHAHADPHRPIYHFLPPANWLNDPNGVAYWNGHYHLFYQYNPGGPFHATIHWGHARSRDLLHWEHLPLALTPTPGGPDADGCWSGCFVDNNGTPTLIYTGMRSENGVKTQTTCLATATDDDLVHWEKYAGNPIIAGPPPQLDVLGFRDHCVWRENGLWYQVIGSGIRGVGGTALLFRSPDLIAWDYVQPVLVRDEHATEPVWTGPMWECPDLFALNNKHVLVVSVWSGGRVFYPVYFVGSYADQVFTPTTLHRLDFGPSYYAPQSMRDGQGRRLQWGWLREGRDLATQEAVDWAGAMSLPRVLTLRLDNTLGVAAAPELEALRDEHYQRTNFDLQAEEQPLDDKHGDALEIIAVFERGDAAEVGLAVRCSPDGEEATYIFYDSAQEQFVIDSHRSSTAPTLHQDMYTAPCPLAPGEPVTLHVFLDRSVIEVFANERCAAAVRVYPTRPDSDGVHLVARGGSARLASLNVWHMRSMW